MVFHLVFAAPCLLVLVRWLSPLAISRWVKAALAVLLIVGSQFHLWNRLSSGSVFAPEFPRPIVILFNWAFGTILLLAVLTVLIDLVALLVAAARRRRLRIAREVRFGAAAGAGLLAAIGVAGALQMPAVRDVEIRNLPGLAPQFEGYRIVHLTDTHTSRLFPESRTRRVVEQVNAADADLIVITGDFIDGSVAMRAADVAPLRGLRARDGVYGVAGNHEYFFDYLAWARHLSGLGTRLLANSHAVVTRRNDGIVIAGVNDVSAPEFGHIGPDLRSALAGAPPGMPVILLDHQPKNARDAAAQGVALQLSGHTHGGMIRGFDRVVAMFNGGFVSGRYEVGAMTLYVGNGAALWPGFALRLGRPPEITRFILRAKP